MLILKHRQALALGAGLLILSGAATFIAYAADSTPSVGSVVAEVSDPAVQADFMIDLSEQPSAIGSIGARDAATIAAAWLGRTDAPAVVVHGSAQVTASDFASEAWIVVFAGGQHPLHADGSFVLDFIGVAIDDSGTPLRTFGRGHETSE